MIHSKNYGFTLIEMTVVLMIMLVLTAMIAPVVMNFSSSAELNSASHELLTVIRSARSYAVTEHKKYEVVFTTITTPQRYWVISSEGEMVGKGYSLPKTVMFDTAVAPFDTVTIATLSFVSNGSVTVISPTNIAIRNDKGKTRTIEIIPETGAVEIK